MACTRVTTRFSKDLFLFNEGVICFGRVYSQSFVYPWPILPQAARQKSSCWLSSLGRVEAESLTKRDGGGTTQLWPRSGLGVVGLVHRYCIYGACALHCCMTVPRRRSSTPPNYYPVQCRHRLLEICSCLYSEKQLFYKATKPQTYVS